jgi:predicted TIM-barrel fold metal-dependent hydrolase
MRVVALEEHFTVPALVRRIDPAAIGRRGFQARKPPADRPNPLELLPELGEQRLKLMDEAGITVQVLSNTGPGPDLVPGADGVAMAREMNDHLAAAVARHPARFAGFAVLPMQSPDACAAELVRAVTELRFAGALINGTTEGRFLDHPSYDDLLAEAVKLDVPIYIHPHPSSRTRAAGLLRRSAAGREPRARICRLGLAFGDGDPRASHGAGRNARPASAAQAHHRPYG